MDEKRKDGYKGGGRRGKEGRKVGNRSKMIGKWKC